MVCIFPLEVVDAGVGCLKMVFLLVIFLAWPLCLLGSLVLKNLVTLSGRSKAGWQCVFFIYFKFVFLFTLKNFGVGNPENVFVLKMFFFFFIS